MKTAVVSEDFHSLCGSAGKARRSLLFEARRGTRPQLVRYLELPPGSPCYHDPHDDDEIPHPTFDDQIAMPRPSRHIGRDAHSRSGRH